MADRRSSRRWIAASLTALAMAVGVQAAPHASAAVLRDWTQRINLDAQAHEANAPSHSPSLSANGRWVAFVSDADNLVPGDTNKERDVFVRDVQTGRIERASVASNGKQGNGPSFNPSISADGRFVAFDSTADNLVPGDTNGRFDVFLRDLQSGATLLISVRPDGGQLHGHSGYPVISGDGMHVAFESGAPDLHPDRAQVEVYAWSRATGKVEWVSRGLRGMASGSSGSPAISYDGRHVAFTSAAPDLVVGDTNQREDVFVRDRATNTTRRVSVNSAGGESNHDSDAASISADGRFVAFESMAYSLAGHDPLPDAFPKMFDPLASASPDVNSLVDVFVHDTATGRTELVSVGQAGEQGTRESYGPSISADGTRIAFVSYADNLVRGDTNNERDVFVRDLAAGTTKRLSVGVSGAQGTGLSYNPAMSPDGTRTAFASDADNLVADDRNRVGDVFLRG
ncbi:MAG: TolB family protein [Sporichthyaceae bacterium]